MLVPGLRGTNLPLIFTSTVPSVGPATTVLLGTGAGDAGGGCGGVTVGGGVGVCGTITGVAVVVNVAGPSELPLPPTLVARASTVYLVCGLRPVIVCVK